MHAAISISSFKSVQAPKPRNDSVHFQPSYINGSKACPRSTSPRRSQMMPSRQLTVYFTTAIGKSLTQGGDDTASAGLAAAPTECDGTENPPCTQNSQLQCRVLSCFLWPPYSPGTAQSLPAAHLPVQMRPHWLGRTHCVHTLLSLLSSGIQITTRESP